MNTGSIAGVLACLICILFADANAFGFVDDTTTRNNAAIADQFYKANGSSLFWYGAKAECDSRRAVIRAVVNDAAYLGIDKRKYSFPADTVFAASTVEKDRRFTVAFIELVRAFQHSGIRSLEFT